MHPDGLSLLVVIFIYIVHCDKKKKSVTNHVKYNMEKFNQFISQVGLMVSLVIK